MYFITLQGWYVINIEKPLRTWECWRIIILKTGINSQIDPRASLSHSELSQETTAWGTQDQQGHSLVPLCSYPPFPHFILNPDSSKASWLAQQAPWGGYVHPRGTRNLPRVTTTINNLKASNSRFPTHISTMATVYSRSFLPTCWSPSATSLPLGTQGSLQTSALSPGLRLPMRLDPGGPRLRP